MDCVIVREIDGNEKEYWNESVQTFEHVHPLNAFDWGKVREIDGWKSFHLVAERSGRFCGALLLLAKRLHFLPYSIFYSPKGPICRPDDRESIEAIHGKVLELAKKNKVIFLRIDPNIQEEESDSFERIISELCITNEMDPCRSVAKRVVAFLSPSRTCGFAIELESPVI